MEVIGDTLQWRCRYGYRSQCEKWIEQAELVVLHRRNELIPWSYTSCNWSNAADEVITYGAPVLPGAMFMLAYAGKVPIMGSRDAMYAKRTIFDLILPRIAAGNGRKQKILPRSEKAVCVELSGVYFPELQFRKIGRKINHKRNERNFRGSKRETGIQEELELYE